MIIMRLKMNDNDDNLMLLKMMVCMVCMLSNIIVGGILHSFLKKIATFLVVWEFGFEGVLVAGKLCTRNRSFLDTLPHFWLLETQFVYLSGATTYSQRPFATVGSSQNRVRI